MTPLRRKAALRGTILVGACAAALFLVAGPRAAGAQAVIDPAMTRSQVIERLGAPIAERTVDGSTFLFYGNGSERRVGMNDVVILREDGVVDAVFRSKARRYSGKSSSPVAISPEAARKRPEAASVTRPAGVSIRPSAPVSDSGAKAPVAPMPSAAERGQSNEKTRIPGDMRPPSPAGSAVSGEQNTQGSTKAAPSPANDDSWVAASPLNPLVDAVRLDDSITVDGVLDEAAWQKATLLTGFTQYLPVDQRPAADSTRVLVWYSATAIYFGIRAYEAHGAVRATLADRDRIDGEDHVQILLDTYLDRRRAFVFAVNGLGVQADGIRADSRSSVTPKNGFGNVDLSPDFIYESKGRLTPQGFEVEMRIPFKSMRYAAGSQQDWGLQVIRQVQHSGFQDTWARMRRAVPGFVMQGGTLRGLHDMKRGLVLDVNPVLTNVTTGTAGAAGAWNYSNRPELGGNVRWGFVPNLTLNATVKPDFSQVEADAQQVASDVRFAINYPERRPFFTDGIELFDQPNQLVYTRRIVQPDAASRISGKVGHTDVAILGAVDGRVASTDGASNPSFGIVRLRRDYGAVSWLGMTLTERDERKDYNRIASMDVRHVFASIYQINAQGALASTSRAGAASSGPLWDLSLNRTGRMGGFLYRINGVSPSFETQTGFIPRRDFVQISLTNRLEYIGARSALVQAVTWHVTTSALSPYAAFFDGKYPLELRAQLNNIMSIRGGWSATITPGIESFGFDPRSYADYRVLRGTGRMPGDTLAFTPGNRVHDVFLNFVVQTPKWHGVVVNLSGYAGTASEFFETALARRTDVTLAADWRPSPKIRVNPTYTLNRFTRLRDGILLSSADIPRLKLEYQVTRSIFLRYVGQYDSRYRDALRDPATDLPILTRKGNGTFAKAGSSKSNSFRNDWLFSYQPSPGTTFFAGYGATLAEDDAFRFRDVQRTADGFFLKLSWLFRLQGRK